MHLHYRALFGLALLSFTTLIGCGKDKAKESESAAASASATPTNGAVVSLRADTGKWMGRCRGCQKATQSGGKPNDDTATAHVSSNAEPYARFTVVSVPGGKIALRSDVGRFLARCSGCVEGGTYPDFVTIHAADEKDAFAQFTVVRLKNGKSALRADNGKYVARCRNCSPGSTQEDTVTAHVSDPEAEASAQWDLVIVPG